MPPPLFLDQTEARKNSFETAPPPPPPYLKVWIRHWDCRLILIRKEDKTL